MQDPLQAYQQHTISGGAINTLNNQYSTYSMPTTANQIGTQVTTASTYINYSANYPNPMVGYGLPPQHQLPCCETVDGRTSSPGTSTYVPIPTSSDCKSEQHHTGELRDLFSMYLPWDSRNPLLTSTPTSQNTYVTSMQQYRPGERQSVVQNTYMSRM